MMAAEGREIRLSVNQDHDVWHWKIAYADNGLAIEQGYITTRLAAQVAAQRAFERGMQRAGVSLVDFNGYRWTERAS